MIHFFRKHGFVYDQLPAILWALVIFVLSSLPNARLPDLPIIPSDKAAHLLVYFVLCGFTYRALKNQNRIPALARWSMMICVLMTVLYGATDEFHQSFVPNRDASLLDLAADAVGAFLFVVIVKFRQRNSSEAEGN